MKRLNVVALAAFVVLLSCQRGRAEIIAAYTFDGNDYVADPSNRAGANTSLDLLNKAVPVIGVTSSEIRFSPGIDPTAALGFAADDYDGALGFSSDANDDRGFATTGQAIFFQVNVQAGATLNLESLDFDSLKTRGDNATGSRVTHTIFVNPPGDPSIDGLAGSFDFLLARAHSHVAPGHTGQSFGGNFTTGRWQADTVDLSSFRDLTGVNTFAIRIHADDGLDRDFGIDNIVLRGQVFGVTAIPEPGGLFAMSLVSGAVWLRRRR